MKALESAAAMLLLALAAAHAQTAAHAQAASQLRLGSVLGEAQDEGFARAETRRTFRFPADHGPHPRYRSEWWYLTASLESADGDAFGVQFTLFRQALRPEPVIGGPWDASQVYLGHLAVTDVAAGRHLEAERLSRGHPRLAGVSVGPFRAHLDGWELAAPGDGTGVRAREGAPTGGGETDVGAASRPRSSEMQPPLVLQGATEDFSVHLELDPRKPIVLQGDGGLSAKGPGQASYYYSVPRLAATGQVRVGSETTAVSGTAWLDREWSTSVLADHQAGWDWFALHLESGEELMVFQLRNESGLRDPYDQGVWVDAGGEAHQLRSRDFSLEPTRFWTDGEGARWPVAWRLSVMGPHGPRQLTVRAAVDDQRMDTLLTYWEGLVWVSDDTGRRVGTGYMELTGYD